MKNKIGIRRKPRCPECGLELDEEGKCPLAKELTEEDFA